MHVLMFSWEYPPHIIGGLGKHVADLLPALADIGATVWLLTPDLVPNTPIVAPTNNTVPVHILRVPPPAAIGRHSIDIRAPSPDAVLLFNHELEQAAIHLAQSVGPFDLIHTHDWLTASVAINLKQRWHVPLVATVHATERGRLRGEPTSSTSRIIDGLEWQLTYEAWRVIVCSQFMKMQLAEQFHTPLDKIDVIPNGVYLQPNPFSSIRERLAFRRRFAEDGERIAFSVGRIVYEKGLHVLIDAWARVRTEFHARLIIAGLGPYREALRMQTHALHLTDAISFPGFISDEDRTRLYHIADMAVIPSLYEPFGIVALEASACGCPVVISETGGLHEVVRLHETGITVTPGSVESLAWGIVHTFYNPHWSYARALNALRNVHELYNWNRIAQMTMATYEQVYAAWQQSDWY